MNAWLQARPHTTISPTDFAPKQYLEFWFTELQSFSFTKGHPGPIECVGHRRPWPLGLHNRPSIPPFLVSQPCLSSNPKGAQMAHESVQFVPATNKPTAPPFLAVCMTRSRDAPPGAAGHESVQALGPMKCSKTYVHDKRVCC
mmetsp:Transcript_3821/g.6162  ORF Transcript_3821/g.6162 Transcript_3821/m.6162 type:complete len:143 (+) Transcript_3821:53-481(+)